MKFNNIYKKTLVAGSVIVGAALITGCSSDDDPVVPATSSAGTTSVRIIHASADAPPVDIKLNNAVAVPGLDYPLSTGFVSIGAGTYDVAVDAIVPGGNLEGVITVDNITFEKDQRYTVVALDDTANISEFVAAESAATPGPGEVAISVLHAATAVKGMDVAVYVTAFNADISSAVPNFSFDFKGQADAGALPAGEYQIRIVAAGNTAAPAYDSGKVDLSGFAGQKLLLAAVNTVNSTTKAASPVKLMAYTDTTQLELIDTRTLSGARVVHLSPDAGAVEVFASSDALGSGVEIIDSFIYTETNPADGISYSYVPAGDYTFDLAAANTGIGSSLPIASPNAQLNVATEYTVIAAGYAAAGTPALDLLYTADSNRSIVTQASVKVLHGAPLAGTVDVYVTPAGQFTTQQVEGGMAGAPLLDDFTFGTITDYVTVPPGDYDIRVVTNSGAGTAAIDVTAFNLAAGSVSTVIARQPVSGGGTPSDFNLIVLSNQ